MKELICIVCPRGCHLEVDEDNGFEVHGNSCPRGEQYGRTEISDPHRVLTSTVRITGGMYHRCPVRTSCAIRKDMILPVMKELDQIELVSPVHRGDILAANILNTGADLIATKDI